MYIQGETNNQQKGEIIMKMKMANEIIKVKTNELKEKIEAVYAEINKLEVNKQTIKNLFNTFQMGEGIKEADDSLNDFINDELDNLVIFTEKHNVETEDLGNLKFKIKNNTIYPEYLLMSLFLEQNYRDIVELVTKKYKLTIPHVLDISTGKIESLKMDEAYYPSQIEEMLTKIDKDLDDFISYFKIEYIKDEIQTILNMVKVKDKINEFINLGLALKKC